LITEFGNKEVFFEEQAAHHAMALFIMAKFKPATVLKKSKECFVMMLPKMNSQLTINAC
jgi:hypothetical protein